MLTVIIGFIFWRAAGADVPLGNWEPAGFGGAGNFLSVCFDQTSQGIVYAASDVAGVFRSSNCGTSWELRSVGLGNVEVSSLAVDPFDPSTLYAGVGAFEESTRSGIYVSHDAGLTWHHLPDSYAKGISFRKYRTANAIAPDPAHQGTILSGSRAHGIWRTTDGGSSWTQVYAAPQTSAPLFNDGTIDDDPESTPYPTPVSVVVFDPNDPTVVYAALDGFGFVRSLASGQAGSWVPLNGGLPQEARVKSVAVAGNGVFYVALATDGIFRITNGGDEWEPANNGLPALHEGAWVSFVAVDPTDPAIAYLSLATYDYPNVWKTTDYGTSWAPMGNVDYDEIYDPTEIWACEPTMSWYVAIDPHNTQSILYTGYWDIIRSEDGGLHWASAIIGAQNTCVTDLVVDEDHPPDEPDVLYATHMDAGLLSSTDNGSTWRMEVPQEYDVALAGHYWRVVITRVAGTKYYFATCDPWGYEYGRVLRSTDGTNWTAVHDQPRPQGSATPFMAGSILGLAADPSSPSTLYFTQDGGQVFKSTDSGTNWWPTAAQPGYDAFTYALTVDENGQVFVGTHGGGLWRSNNGGASWGRVLVDCDWIYHAVASQGAVYATTGEDADLHASRDGGDTWQQLTDFELEDYGDGVGAHGMAVCVAPGQPEHILFSRMDTWHPADAGEGIFESTDGGLTWSERGEGLRHRNVSALAAAADGGMFIGTWGGGIWRHADASVPNEPVEPSTVLRLLNIRPNPSSGRTTLRFETCEATCVRVSVRDAAGRLVSRLRDEHIRAGTHCVEWDPADAPSGIYFFRIQGASLSGTAKCVLVK
jgi:photosystem II stability/assembly factor-like uncharacterized protein